MAFNKPQTGSDPFIARIWLRNKFPRHNVDINMINNKYLVVYTCILDFLDVWEVIILWLILFINWSSACKVTYQKKIVSISISIRWSGGKWVNEANEFSRYIYEYSSQIAVVAM